MSDKPAKMLEVKIGRLALNNFVDNLFNVSRRNKDLVAQIKFCAAHHTGGLSRPSLYRLVWDSTLLESGLREYAPKVRNLVAKSVILRLASHLDIKLPKHYRITNMQQELIEELPKEKPTYELGRCVAKPAEIKCSAPVRMDLGKAEEICTAMLSQQDVDFDKALAEIEKKVYNTLYPELFSNQFQDAPKEKPMRDLTVSKPVMVGNVNILEADEATLAELIREAQDQIKANEDLAEVSAKYQKKNKALETTIALMVKQLDKL